ncbi:MAG: hypothetical protein M1819_002006 [Sarea resinae]|nr:MAG: hypothetical protein M1819_002006 [Sarea resinae]
MSGNVSQSAVEPAQLSFLAIYNPSLSTSDETLRDQIVFYYSKAARRRRRGRSRQLGKEDAAHEAENERLRQIGLAQGMVEFARSFSDGEAVESVETERSRIILHELEEGWWILASIDLTRMPSNSTQGGASDQRESSSTEPAIEYSSREVAPPELLLRQIERAHSVFLLHHAQSLSQFFARLPRLQFCDILDRFWSRFATEWDVLLHGNPACDIFNGLKLAAGGEIGIGVGEEEWGSGEREVLEGFVGRTEGLIDLVVSRFGTATSDSEAVQGESANGKRRHQVADMGSESEKWIGVGSQVGHEDGVVFSGVGAVSRSSLKNIAAWMEWIYKDGEDTYGVRDNPTANRRKRWKKPKKGLGDSISQSNGKAAGPDAAEKAIPNVSQSTHNVRDNGRDDSPIRIPPPIVSAASGPQSLAGSGDKTSQRAESPETATGTLMKYLTLGYGSSWGGSLGRSQGAATWAGMQRGERPDASTRVSNDESTNRKSMRHLEPRPEDSNEQRNVSPKPKHPAGRFIIGLAGDLEKDDQVDESVATSDLGNGDQEMESSERDNRLLLRTLHVAVPEKKDHESVPGEQNSYEHDKDKKVRAVIYVHQPFMFTFIFELDTATLAMPTFYRSIHHQLGPLQRPLLSSTSPAKANARLANASSLRNTSATPNAQPIYDLVYDPTNLTVHTSIPNIPEPSAASTNDGRHDPSSPAPPSPPWVRVEALNVHIQILNTYASTRRRMSELERTCKTSRGWWVVWLRFPHSETVGPDVCGPLSSSSSSSSKNANFREAFLVRKASDHAAAVSSLSSSARKISSTYRRNGGGGGFRGSGGWGPARLAEGIGIDTRSYIEGLLNLNR